MAVGVCKQVARASGLIDSEIAGLALHAHVQIVALRRVEELLSQRRRQMCGQGAWWLLGHWNGPDILLGAVRVFIN